MLVIAFDSSLAGCSVALVEVAGGREAGAVPARRLAVLGDERPQGQAATLVPLLQRAMAEGGRDFGALSRIGVTTGPGSFAGVRIGLATAAGLALALGLPVCGIGTLPALAAAMLQAPGEAVLPRAGGLGLQRQDGAVLAVVDSRRGEVFAALYGAAPDATATVALPRELLAPRLLPLAALPDWLAGALAPGAALQVTGDAAEAAAEVLRAGGWHLTTIQAVSRVDATVLAVLAGVLPQPDGLPEPVYLRPPDVSPPAADRHAALRRGPAASGPSGISGR